MKIFIYDDEPDILLMLSMSLELSGYDVDTFSGNPSDLLLIDLSKYDVLVLDYLIRGRTIDPELLLIASKYPSTPKVVYSAFVEIDSSIVEHYNHINKSNLEELRAFIGRV